MSAHFGCAKSWSLRRPASLSSSCGTRGPLRYWSGMASPLKSVGLHKLNGDRKGQWAMTVNARWRICFIFRKGDAHDVEIVDYHKG